MYFLIWHATYYPRPPTGIGQFLAATRMVELLDSRGACSLVPRPYLSVFQCCTLIGEPGDEARKAEDVYHPVICTLKLTAHYDAVYYSSRIDDYLWHNWDGAKTFDVGTSPVHNKLIASI